MKDIYIIQTMSKNEDGEVAVGVLADGYADRADAIDAMLADFEDDRREWVKNIPSDITARVSGTACHLEDGTTGEEKNWYIAKVSEKGA